MFKYGVTSGPYFPVFALNTRKYRPEITLFGHFSRSDLERQKQSPVVFYKKGIPKNFAKFTGKQKETGSLNLRIYLKRDFSL